MSPVRFEDMNYQQRDYDKWQAYGQAKSAQSLMAVELDRREKDNGLRALSVHPGGIFTPLQRHLGNAEMAEFGWTDSDGILPRSPQSCSRQQPKAVPHRSGSYRIAG